MKSILLVGTHHKGCQIRPQTGPRDGSDAFKQFLLEVALRKNTVKTIAEEMSAEALMGRNTVGQEIANEKNLSHILCEPNCYEREILKISKDNTPLDIKKREKEWLRRLNDCKYPVLFICGSSHVSSFSTICRDGGVSPIVVTEDFEPQIPLDRRIF